MSEIGELGGVGKLVRLDRLDLHATRTRPLRCVKTRFLDKLHRPPAWRQGLDAEIAPAGSQSLLTMLASWHHGSAVLLGSNTWTIPALTTGAVTGYTAIRDAISTVQRRATLVAQGRMAARKADGSLLVINHAAIDAHRLLHANTSDPPPPPDPQHCFGLYRRGPSGRFEWRAVTNEDDPTNVDGATRDGWIVLSDPLLAEQLYLEHLTSDAPKKVVARLHQRTRAAATLHELHDVDPNQITFRQRLTVATNLVRFMWHGRGLDTQIHDGVEQRFGVDSPEYHTVTFRRTMSAVLWRRYACTLAVTAAASAGAVQASLMFDNELIEAMSSDRGLLSGDRSRTAFWFSGFVSGNLALPLLTHRASRIVQRRFDQHTNDSVSATTGERPHPVGVMPWATPLDRRAEVLLAATQPRPDDR